MKLLKISKTESVFLGALFLSSFLLRIIKISDSLFFDYEQGRDALAAKGIYTLTHLPLIGPPSSMGGVFHGPYYYYLLAVPYGLTHGNPLAASLFLILLSSLLPIILYFLFREVFSSKLIAASGAVLGSISYQYIILSRWISNVTPSVVFVAISFYFLWRYHKSKKAQDFLSSVFSASIGTQFEINFLAQFLVVYILLFLFRLIKFPNLKTLFLGILVGAVVFSPLILFDFRKQHISSHSLLSFMSSPTGKGKYDFSAALLYYKEQVSALAGRSLVNTNLLGVNVLFYLLLVLGLFFSFIKKREAFLFFTSWALMPLPALLVGAPLPHLYIAAGMGIIGLGLCAVVALYNETHWRKALFILIPIIAFNLLINIRKLDTNKDVFFTTIQEGMNLKDEKLLFAYMHNKAKGKPYYFEAFTIPSLHQEGWQYLHNFYYPNENSPQSNLVFIAIEKQVYPYWEDRWIGDLGHTELIEERYFGLLRLQVRERI